MLKHTECQGLNVSGMQVLKHKAVQEEMTEAKALVDKLKAEDEKAERRAAKSAPHEQEPTPERVVFDTMLEVASGEYEVHETAAQPGAPS